MMKREPVAWRFLNQISIWLLLFLRGNRMMVKREPAAWRLRSHKLC
jgi:hypothetical protein